MVFFIIVLKTFLVQTLVSRHLPVSSVGEGDYCADIGLFLAKCCYECKVVVDSNGVGCSTVCAQWKFKISQFHILT